MIAIHLEVDLDLNLCTQWTYFWDILNGNIITHINFTLNNKITSFLAVLLRTLKPLLFFFFSSWSCCPCCDGWLLLHQLHELNSIILTVLSEDKERFLWSTSLSHHETLHSYTLHRHSHHYMSHSAHNNYQSYCKTVCSQRIQRYAQQTLLKLMNTEVGDYFILSAASKQVDYPVRVWLPKAAGEQTEMNLWLYSMTGLLGKTISAVGWSHFLLNWSPWIHEWGRTCGGGSEITVLFFPSTSSSSLQKLQHVTIQ